MEGTSETLRPGPIGSTDPSEIADPASRSRVISCMPELSFPCGFPRGSAGKESACNAKDLSLILGWEDPLEKGMATHSSILA